MSEKLETTQPQNEKLFDKKLFQVGTPGDLLGQSCMGLQYWTKIRSKFECQTITCNLYITQLKVDIPN